MRVFRAMKGIIVEPCASSASTSALAALAWPSATSRDSRDPVSDDRHLGLGLDAAAAAVAREVASLEDDPDGLVGVVVGFPTSLDGQPHAQTEVVPVVCRCTANVSRIFPLRRKTSV